MVEGKLQPGRELVHDFRQALDGHALRVEFEAQRGILPERDKLRQHPRNVNLHSLSKISDTGKRFGGEPVHVRFVFWILSLQVALQQSLFRGRQQSLEPALLTGLFQKSSKALLWKRIPINQNPEMIGQAFRQLFLQQRTLQKIQAALL